MGIEKKTIDSHMHLYHWFDENGATFFEFFDKIQAVTGVRNLSIASLTDKIHGGADINIMAALYKLHNLTAYASAGIVYPAFPVCPPLPEGMDALTQYQELMDIGFDGIKILYKPDAQKEAVLPISDPFYEPLFAQAEKDGTHFLWHVADPESFWSVECKSFWNYSDGTYPSYQELFEQVFDVLKKHPKLSVTFAHFMFHSEHPEILEEIFRSYENVGIDITPGTEMYRNFKARYDYYRDFFERHADRIVYGTDTSVPQSKDFENKMTVVYKAIATDETVNINGCIFKGFALPESASERILSKNFLRNCGERPKPVNKKALLKYIHKYAHLISNEENKQQILKFVQEWAE